METREVMNLVMVIVDYKGREIEHDVPLVFPGTPVNVQQIVEYVAGFPCWLGRK